MILRCTLYIGTLLALAGFAAGPASVTIVLAGFAASLTGCSDSPDDDDASAIGDDDSPPSPTPDPGADSPVLMVSDGGNYKVQFIRTDTRAVFYELDLTTLYDECNAVDSFCVLTALTHSTHDGRDYLDMNVGQVDSEGNPANAASVRRIRLSDPPEPVYTLKSFDFSALPGGIEVCDYDPADPCKPGRSPFCSIAFPHDLQVLYDDPASQYVELLITDLATQRVMKVDFDYRDGNSCGRVAWQLDRNTEGWGSLYLPNNAEYWEQDGLEYLLTSYYSSAEILGTGKIELWKRASSGQPWAKVWTFPDPASSDMPYLNTPHSPILVEDPIDGGLLLRYGHSRGDGTFWRAGYQGSIGAARLETLESQPEYRFESLFPAGDPLTPTGFIRDLELTADGRYLVTDSGCELYFNCPLPGRVYLIDPEEAEGVDGRSGAWTGDRSEQTFVDLDMQRLEPFVCGYSTTYEADFMMRSQLGDDLGRRWSDAGGRCPLTP